MEQIALSLNQVFGFSIGISAIVACLISALWSIYFNRIKEGQRAEFQKQIDENKSEFEKQLENLKAKNEKCNYISKTQFDAEFKIYQELSEACYDMTLDILDLFPKDNPILIEQQKNNQHNEKLYKRSQSSNFKLQILISKYASFITKEIYDLYDSFRKKCKKQTDMFYNIHFEQDKKLREKNIDLSKDNWEQTAILLNIYYEITDKLREYLKSLKVLED